MYITTPGLVLRETEYKESSRILTVLTASNGKLTVRAQGAKRRGSKTAAATQLLALSEMTLFENRDRYTLTEARSVELFRGLREDIAKLSLGTYFAELMDAISDEDAPSPELLSLGLNALYAVSNSVSSDASVKAAFELRAMCLAGFEPLLGSCAVCGREDPASPELALEGGTLLCASCRPEGAGECLSLLPGTLAAMRYITGADPKRICSFRVSAQVEKQLSRVCEAYLLTQLGRGFASLDFYRTVS